MSRPLRIEYEDAFYHVMNRGRSRQTVFHNPDYYQAFLQCLDEAHKRFGLEVQAYCLMSNHYHLLIKTPRANLSRIMRHIDGLYTQRHNRLRKRDGSLFRGRYKAILIEASSYLLQVSRYIHRNPIETKVSPVEAIEAYPWSSYACYINRSPSPDWLNRDAVYGELASYRRYQAYRQYVDQGNDQQTKAIYRQMHTPSILGGEAFKNDMKRKLSKKNPEISLKLIQPPIAIPDIIGSVATHYQIANDDILRTRRGKGAKNLPRWIAMKLCQEVGSARLTDIAFRFNVGHYSTVSQTIGRLNRLMQEDRRVKTIYNMLSQDLTPK